MRSPTEITFRLRQEFANVAMLVWPPTPTDVELPAGSIKCLPDPDKIVGRLRGTDYAKEVERLADLIVQHRFPLLGIEVETGPGIDWRRDYVCGVSTGLNYFRRVPYLNYEKVGDHKIVWELNRHQHLVVLAQAYRITRRREFLAEMTAQLQSWISANPFLRGINWTSALEVAFRALSWIWIYHLTSADMQPAFRRDFVTQIYRHGCFLEHNLSIYFSPNTHLLGEAVALHALGMAFPEFPTSLNWRSLGGRLVAEAMDLQVQADGSHFEQSTYYHVYALDLFLFHYLLNEVPKRYRETLILMATYLDALLGPQRSLSFLGDDDGGRVFHPYGPRDRFGSATLTTCAMVLSQRNWHYSASDWFEQAAWWVGGMPPSGGALTRVRRLFEQAGVAVLTRGDLHIIVDSGKFGAGSAGHSHSDTLSLVVRLGNEEILVDSGTYTYVAEPQWRDWFRGSGAHNTMRFDAQDQADSAGPFRWNNPPAVRVSSFTNTPESDFVEAVCEHHGFTHRRQIRIMDSASVEIVDDVSGPPGEHLIEQFWHPGQAMVARSTKSLQIGDRARLDIMTDGPDVELSVGGADGWRSKAFGEKSEAPVIRVHQTTSLPITWKTTLYFSR